MKLSSMPAAVGAGGYSGRGWQRGMRRRFGSLNSSSLMCPTKTKTTTRSQRKLRSAKKSVQKIQGYDHESREEEKEGRSKFFFAASYVLKNLEVTFFAAHFFAACEEGS